MHLDKHVVKMIIEYAQLLSTAHRLLDGHLEEHITPEGRRKKFWLLHGEAVTRGKKFNGDDGLIIENQKVYSLSHQNHPCAIWCRESDSNYHWLYDLFKETSHEFTHRYGKIHKTWADTKDFLSKAPRNIAAGDLTPWPQAMGEEFKDAHDSIKAYQNYYVGAKAPFARWTNRPVPDWFKNRIKDYDGSHFER